MIYNHEAQIETATVECSGEPRVQDPEKFMMEAGT